MASAAGSECGGPIVDGETTDGAEGGIVQQASRGLVGLETATEMSDPRLQGTYYLSLNTDVFREPAGTGVYTYTWRIENEDGTWQGSQSGFGFPDGTQAVVTTPLVGEGAYEGLTAIWESTFDGAACAWTVRGLVFEGELPPVPEPYLGSTADTAADETPQASAPVLTDLQGRVLFTRAGGAYGDETVFLSDADGSNERMVGEPDSSGSIWALRDGSLLIRSTSTPDDRLAPTISAIDGSDARLFPLPDDKQFGSGPLSPDGSRVVLETFDTDMNALGVHIANIDGSGLEALTKEPFIPGDFSPDGQEVLLWKFEQAAGDGPPTGSLWLVGADGLALRQLTPAEAPVQCCFNFRWSPDGARIVFAGPEGGLWTISPEGTELREIFHDPDRWAITPTWSPDGSMIMFALDPDRQPMGTPSQWAVCDQGGRIGPHPLYGRNGLQAGAHLGRLDARVRHTRGLRKVARRAGSFQRGDVHRLHQTSSRPPCAFDVAVNVAVRRRLPPQKARTAAPDT